MQTMIHEEWIFVRWFLITVVNLKKKKSSQNIQGHYCECVGYDITKETQFFPSSGCVDTAMLMHYMGTNYTYREKAWR